MDIVNWLLNLGQNWPDLVALGTGSLVGYVFTAMIELYFLPILTNEAEKRRQKGLTFLLCWFASTACSTILWAFMDPKDPVAMRVSVSCIVSILSFAGYPLIAQVATNFFPRLGSAWRRPNGEAK